MRQHVATRPWDTPLVINSIILLNYDGIGIMGGEFIRLTVE